MNRKPNIIKQRIDRAKMALQSYPKWVRENNYFQGGESFRESKDIQKCIKNT